MGYRGYVTLIVWREDGFVFRGEQLALVFQFQREELTAAEEYRDNYYFPLLHDLYSSKHEKQKKTLFRQIDTLMFNTSF